MKKKPTFTMINLIKDNIQDEEKLIKDAVSTLRKVQCRLCKGEHWTTKCPYKDNLQPFMDQNSEKQSIHFFSFFALIHFTKRTLDENVASTTNNATNQGQTGSSGTTGETTNRWVAPSLRRGGSGTAYPNDRTSTRPGGYSGRSNDMRKQGSTSFLSNQFVQICE